MRRITPQSIKYKLYRRGVMSKHTFFAFVYEYFMSKHTHKGGCHFRAEVSLDLLIIMSCAGTLYE